MSNISPETSKEDKRRRKLHTPVRLFLFLGLSIFAAETLIMFILSALPPLPTAIEAYVDSTLLLVLLGPSAYLFLLRPMVLQITERKRAEEELRRHHDHLEELVEERTAELAETVGELKSEINERKRAEEAVRATKKYLRTLLEGSPDAIISTDREGIITFFRPGAEALLGYRQDEVLGRYVTEVYENEERAKEVMRRMREGGGTVSAFETPLRAKDGSIIPVLISAAILYDEEGNEAGTVGFNKDLRERKQAEEEVRLLQTMALAVGEAEDLDSALGVALRKVCEVTGWVFGEAWIPSADGSMLECSPVWHARVEELKRFRVPSQEIAFPPGVGLPGRAWSSKQPAWMRDVSTDKEFLRAALALEIGFKAGMAIPVLADNEAVAVMVFYVLEPCEEDERLVGLVSAIANQLGSVIQRKRAEERYRTVVESSPGCIKLLDLEGTILECNTASAKCFEQESKNSLIGQNLLSLFSKRNRPTLEEAIERARQGEETRQQLQTPTPEGYSKWLGITVGPVRDETGRVSNILFAGRDISDRQVTEQKLIELATTDMLTKLYNRAYFSVKLKEELKRAERYNTSFSLMLIDIDHFKTVNDTLGHQAGDAYLEAVAGLISRSTRLVDTVARYGGEEFAIILPNARISDAAIVADRMRERVGAFDVSFNGHTIRRTISIGIASYPAETIKDADALLAAADHALYAAKGRGRNAVVTHHEGTELAPTEPPVRT